MYTYIYIHAVVDSILDVFKYRYLNPKSAYSAFFFFFFFQNHLERAENS